MRRASSRIVATCGTALAAAAVTASVAASLTACTGGGSRPGALATPSPAGTSSNVALAHGPAVRWWSNSVATAGSTIDPRNPAAVATKLAPSRAEYCEMLAQTLKAGKSVLAGVGANDPALANSAIAFVTELQRVAPTSVADSWRALSPALLSLVRSDGSAPAQNEADLAATIDATKAIAADAKQNCRLNLAAPKR